MKRAIDLHFYRKLRGASEAVEVARKLLQSRCPMWPNHKYVRHMAGSWFATSKASSSDTAHYSKGLVTHCHVLFFILPSHRKHEDLLQASVVPPRLHTVSNKKQDDAQLPENSPLHSAPLEFWNLSWLQDSPLYDSERTGSSNPVNALHSGGYL